MCSERLMRVQPAHRPVLELSPGIENHARVGETEAEDDGAQAELFEAEHRRDRPARCRDQSERDRAPGRAIQAFSLRSIAAQQPNRDARQTNRDQVREVRRGDQPDRVADQEKADRRSGRDQRGSPRHVVFGTEREKAREDPVVGKLREGSRCAGERLQRTVKHVEDHEPDAQRLGERAEYRRKRRSQLERQIAAQRGGSEHAEKDDGQHDEVHARHRRAREHRARDVARRIDRFAGVTCCGLECRRREPDEIQPGHQRGEGAEPALEWRRELKRRREVPVDVPGDDRHERGQERKNRPRRSPWVSRRAPPIARRTG